MLSLLAHAQVQLSGHKHRQLPIQHVHLLCERATAAAVVAAAVAATLAVAAAAVVAAAAAAVLVASAVAAAAAAFAADAAATAAVAAGAAAAIAAASGAAATAVAAVAAAVLGRGRVRRPGLRKRDLGPLHPVYAAQPVRRRSVRPLAQDGEWSRRRLGARGLQLRSVQLSAHGKQWLLPTVP